MYAVGRIGSYISQGVYTVSGPFHPFGGAVDIIVVEQPDGSFKSSPWYVRFGKFQGVLKTKEKVVNINVNGVDANFNMCLDHKGEAYFLKEFGVETGETVVYPSSSGDETDGQSNSNRRPIKSKSYNYDADKLNSEEQIDASNAKGWARTGSRQARILGLVFGRRSRRGGNYQDGECDADVVRLSSLERAEIAADLLEMKWSTNLVSNKSRKDNFSHGVLDDKVAKSIQVNGEETCVDSSVHNDRQNRNVHSILEEETASPNEQMTSSSNVSPETLESSNEEASVSISCIGTMEQVGESILEENSGKASEISRTIDEFGVGNAYRDEHEDQSCLDSKIKNELEACHGKQFDEEQACDKKDVALSGCRISAETASDRVQSFVYCGTSESSILGLDGTYEKTQETLYLASGRCGKVHVHPETLHVTTELPRKDTDVERANDIELEKDAVAVYENHSDQVKPAVFEYNEAYLEEPLKIPASSTNVVRLEPTLCSIEEVNSKNICTIPNEVREWKDISDDLLQYVKSTGDSQELYADSVPKKAVSNSLSENSEEEQFLFSDPDEFKLSKVQCMESSSSDCAMRGDHPAFSSEGIKEVNGSVNANDEACSSLDMFGQYNPLNDLENSAEELRVMSSPISIHRSHKADEEVGRLVESLPNMRSPTIKLGVLDSHHPLSHSLDSNSESLKWTLFKEHDSSRMKSDVDGELYLAEEQPKIEDSQISEEQTNFLSNPAVEISLCKHLLYEGMGAHAASEAFDAEKLDVDKFTSLGPAVLKNDRLVVRIGGCYFPWDVAASIVLGMVAFGIKEIFESKSMIAVDRVEKSLIGVPAEAIVSPGGSWNLWPFSLRRSSCGKVMQPALTDTKSFDTEVASESINDTKSVCKPKLVKKTIRALTPTSEQLAALHLKEGRNTVTFTFSTAMLGKQQVDARIYLWKWNTRIVISDVDGTITKSDVLGQFMPLVGMDWSQTGVAHLFSAIKENGYQLLFLSARAISQAYHTRQFLFNLKQDGKALPDGPVVISPDGLFPSLFREVIRRAPHEFKISCLEDIRALFPSDCNPFYAGFGNRDTDEISYLKVGIPSGKIFTINPKGEIAVNRRIDTKSYSLLHALVHGMFPPTNSTEQEDFNAWNYWKLPPPDIDV